MRTSFRFLTAIVLLAATLAGAGTASADQTLILAAASTKDAMIEIAKTYAGKSRGVLKLSVGASGDLAKQIENGAPANIFISADTTWMDYLAGKNLILPDSRKDLLSNRLVLIAPAGSTMSIELKPGAPLAAALGEGKIAVCDPESVPAGRYAKAALIKLGIWDSIAPKVVGAKDVRAALALVGRGEAPAGIVYSTDARLSKKVKVVAVFPDDSHPRIVYPVGIVAGHDTAEAKAFYDYLSSAEAGAVFEKFGFILLH